MYENTRMEIINQTSKTIKPVPQRWNRIVDR